MNRPPGDAVIQVTGLRKSFGDIAAVGGVDLQVQRGELFAFLGPNGAGKSTTVNMLCTLLKPDAGSVMIDGLDVHRDATEVRRRIGIVFQDQVLDNLLTVRENLRARGRFYWNDSSELTQAVERVAEAASVEDFIDRPYGKLSGGQRRRADIARALLATPTVLFMDEPTTGLDPQTRRHVWETITRLQAENDMTIFLTTHYMEEAARSDYVVIVDDGRVVAEGTPAQMKDQYAFDELRVVPRHSQGFGARLTEVSLDSNAIKQIGDQFVVRLGSTVEAIDLLSSIRDEVESFEVLHGTMDDVFINVAGKDIRE